MRHTSGSCTKTPEHHFWLCGGAPKPRAPPGTMQVLHGRRRVGRQGVDAEDTTPRGQALASERYLRQEWPPMQLRKLQQRSKHGAAAPPFSFLQLPPSRNKSVLFLTPLRDPPPSWSINTGFSFLFLTAWRVRGGRKKTGRARVHAAALKY